MVHDERCDRGIGLSSVMEREIFCFFFSFFCFNDTATTEIYTLSLHDALPIFFQTAALGGPASGRNQGLHRCHASIYQALKLLGVVAVDPTTGVGTCYDLYASGQSFLDALNMVLAEVTSFSLGLGCAHFTVEDENNESGNKEDSLVGHHP